MIREREAEQEIFNFRQIIMNDIKRFVQDRPPLYSAEQCNQASALEKALAITMAHYVEYAYRLGKKVMPEWKYKVGESLLHNYVNQSLKPAARPTNSEHLDKELFEL